MGFSLCYGASWLKIILLLTWSYKGLAQNTSLSLSSWTFATEGYLAFNPQLSVGQNQKIGLDFKTKQPHGLLYCHTLVDNEENKNPLLPRYEFCAELFQGYLKVTYQLNEHKDLLKIGKALNDDQWHSVVISLDTTYGDLSINLDDLPIKTENLYAYSNALSDPTAILDWSKLPSVVTFGGLDKSIQRDYKQFIGCLNNLKYTGSDGVFWNVSPTVIHGVTVGCTDLCEKDNLCQRGSCINYYTHIVCDCFGTEYEGEYCQNIGPTEVTLQGFEWLTYQLYKNPEDRAPTEESRISLQFKSDRGSGVLLYAVGNTEMSGFHHTHVISSIHNGVVKASIAFGDDVIEREMGIGVDDNRWHNLTILHNKTIVEFQLDGARYEHVVLTDNYFLSLDPVVYFFGGDNFAQTLGLQVTQNFVGCVRNVYYNEYSVLHQIKTNVTTSGYHGGKEISYGCYDVTNIPLTYKKSGTTLLLNGYSGAELDVEFGFRTVRDKAILFYAETESLDVNGYRENGYFEVWIEDRLPVMKYVPSFSNKNLVNVSVLPKDVSDGVWHRLRIQISNGLVKVAADNLSKTIVYSQYLQLMGLIGIGYGNRNYEEHTGFVGCIRNLVIQEKFIDPILLLDSPPGPYDVVNGIILDGCSLIDYCLNGPHCEHEGKCLSDWSGVSCDCSKTAYDGKRCHFPKYKKTCDSYYQAGSKQTGVYILDLDGTGPLDPVYAQCIMGYYQDGELYGQTVVENNLWNNSIIWHQKNYELMVDITYREMDHIHLIKLTQTSSSCEQYIQYDCYKAPLRLGRDTILRAASGEVVEYIGTDSSRSCECSQDKSCQNPSLPCNCDSGDSMWLQDSGYNRINSQLPVKAINFRGHERFTDDSNRTMSMGPLKCWANKESKGNTAVTFTKEMSYLKIRPWKSGDLHISFRTLQDQAIIMYQSSSPDNANTAKVVLTSGRVVRFEFKIKNRTHLLDLQTSRDVNDGDWHLLSIEVDLHDIRCGVDTDSQFVNVYNKESTPWAFDGPLYLGGMNSSLRENIDGVPGLVGCLKGLIFNGGGHDLTREVDSSITDIFPGCMAYCLSNPCMNGAECVERWESYECICSNKWAHWGRNCEVNMNEDLVTFTGAPKSYLTFDLGTDRTLLDATIIFSFRTKWYYGLLFYMYDELNNFIQLDSDYDRGLILRYNHFDTVFWRSMAVDGIRDGQWKQVIIQTFGPNGKPKIMVNNESNSMTMPYERYKLYAYSTNPFRNPEDETVKPPRPDTKTSPFVRLLVGGAPEPSEKRQNFQGCIRGVKIGDMRVNLQEAATKSSQNVKPYCESGCENSPCHNGGKCFENWGNKSFTCDCSATDFAGKMCELEASGVFEGKSVVEYTFSSIRETVSENISFVFKSNQTDAPMALLMVYSKKHRDHDYILIILKPSVGIYIQSSPSSAYVGGTLPGQFCDGRPHRFEYIQGKTEAVVKVHKIESLNGEARAKVETTEFPLDDLDTILVGGLVIDPDIYDVKELYRDVQNFTGCLSEVTYIPDLAANEKIQPMKELRDLQNGSIEVYGSEVVQCSPVWQDEGLKSTAAPISTTEKSTSVTKNKLLTMPPWNPGSAVPPAPATTKFAPVTTTTPTTTTTTESTTILTTTVMSNVSLSIAGQGAFTLDETTLWIAISIIAFLLLIAVIIALILRRLKRRSYSFKNKGYPDDIEIKQPLNKTPAASPPSRHEDNIHLATFDEFSMVSATLAPANRRRENGYKPGTVQTLPADMRNSNYPVQRSFQPLPGDNGDFPLPNIYSKKKNRPASSISEVLEEMERQRKAKELGVDPDQYEESPVSGRSDQNHGEGELEWDPQIDKCPLTVNQSEESDDGKFEETKDSSDTDSDPLKVLEQQGDLAHEYNGDSGYSADSHRNGEEEQLIMEDNTDIITPPTPDDSKMYYDISGLVNDHGSPNCASTPRKKLLDHMENGT